MAHAIYTLAPDGRTARSTDRRRIQSLRCYLPGNQWILNDTYPDQDRRQHPCLDHAESRRVIPLGHFHLPPQYRGEWRCDTHPRFSSDGKSVVIDSPPGGDGRQMHLVDLRGLVT